MIYVGDANDPATTLKDSDDFFSTYCASHVARFPVAPFPAAAPFSLGL